MSTPDFANRSYIVTGGASGIGAATVEALCRAGARVTLFDVQPADDLAARHPACRAESLDIRDADAVRAAVARAAEIQGGLDGLVNNAGVAPPALLSGTDEAEWDRILDINLKGAFLCTRAAVDALAANGGGAIVNLSSVAGKNISLGAGVPYTTTKWGMLGFTRHLAYELAPRGIRVNAVCPGPTLTPLIGGDAMDEGQKQAAGRGVPLGRIVEPADIAEAILFFLSDSSAMCTGSELVVDGGVLLGSAAAYPDYFEKRGGRYPE